MSKALNDLVKLAEEISKNTDLGPEERDDDIDFIVNSVKAFPKYFNSVIMAETQTAMLRFKCDREDYIEKVEQADRARRNCHINAAHSVNKLNRMAKSYGLEAIFKYEGYENRELCPEPAEPNVPAFERAAEEDRQIAADIAYVFCKEVFLDEKNKEKYNIKAEYTRNEREDELYHIGKDNGYFKMQTTLDEMIEIARASQEKQNEGQNHFDPER